MQLESILNVSQLAIRAPASPGSTAAILLFSLSLSLSDSAARRPHPNLTRLGRSDTLFPIFRCLHMDGPLGRICIRWYVIVKPNTYLTLTGAAQIGQKCAILTQKFWIFGAKSLFFCMVIAIFVNRAYHKNTRGYNFSNQTTPQRNSICEL